MKRKISMLLSIILVATSLIACNETTQVVDNTTPSSTSDPINSQQPSDDFFEIEAQTTIEPTPIAVILESEFYVENPYYLNQFLDMIANSTVVEQKPENPSGSFVYEFYLVSSDDTIREFEMNSAVLFEIVNEETIYYLIDENMDIDFIHSIIEGTNNQNIEHLTTEPSTPTENMPDFSDLYNETILLFNQLSSSTLDLDFEQQAIIDESMVFKVKDFSSFDEINAHLLTIFSQEIVDELVLLEQSYIEYDGELYGKPSDAPSNINIGKELSREVIQEYPITTIKVEFETLENGDVTGSKTFDYICELIDDNWIFTSFPSINM